MKHPARGFYWPQMLLSDSTATTHGSIMPWALDILYVSSEV